jgi:acyl-CoA hydrolase
VTVAVDGMLFHTPIHVGDEVSVYADLISTGRTSMKFQVEAWRRSRDGDEQVKVTEAVFTFVAIDSGSRPHCHRVEHTESFRLMATTILNYVNGQSGTIKKSDHLLVAGYQDHLAPDLL